MLVILMKDKLLQPSTVCQGCLMANDSGLPRWQKGKLRCGRLVNNLVSHSEKDAPQQVVCEQDSALAESVLTEYECAMGFRLAKIAD